MKKELDAKGYVALYINFDFDKADIKWRPSPLGCVHLDGDRRRVRRTGVSGDAMRPSGELPAELGATAGEHGAIDLPGYRAAGRRPGRAERQRLHFFGKVRR